MTIRAQSEDKIIADIVSGFKSGNSYTVIKNREEAIYHALERSGGKAAVAVIGKGCEEYSVFGEQYVAYNDKSAVQSAINKLKAKESTQGENKT